jgi:hypothetical protein
MPYAARGSNMKEREIGKKALISQYERYVCLK